MIRMIILTMYDVGGVIVFEMDNMHDFTDAFVMQDVVLCMRWMVCMMLLMLL